MTNRPRLPRPKQVIRAQGRQWENRTRPGQTGKTGLLREKLPRSAERLAAFLRLESTSDRETPPDQGPDKGPEMLVQPGTLHLPC